MLDAGSSTVPPTELQSQDVDPYNNPEEEISEGEGRDGTLSVAIFDHGIILIDVEEVQLTSLPSALDSTLVSAITD